MAEKKKKKIEPYESVKELNWEETEIRDTGLEDVPASWTVLDQLAQHLFQVAPEIRNNNPVWHWALCDDHCTFVFRDGRKVTINL